MTLNWIEHVEKLNEVHAIARAHDLGYDISCEEGEGEDRWFMSMAAVTLGLPVYFTETYTDLDLVLSEALEYLRGLAVSAH
jgi:hypothetical protein